MESGKLKVVCVHNQLDPVASREIRDLVSGRPLSEYVKEFFPFAPDDFDVAVNLNGRPVEPEKFNELVLSDGDILAFCAVPHGGGDGGKNPMAMILQIVLVAAVIWAAPVLAGAMGFVAETTAFAVAQAVIGGVMMAAGGLLINAICPPPGFEPMPQGVANSPTYSWNVEPNRLGEGLPLPVLYGEHRITPPLIARHVETVDNKQYLNLLYLVADHYVDYIGDIKINDTPAEYFDGVDIEVRKGAVNQEVIQFFSDTRADIPVRIKLSREWVTRQTVGNGVEGFGVGLYCPNGLGYYNAEGGVDPLCVQIEMQYRRVGDTVWTAIEDVNRVPITVPAYRWSAGYYGGLGSMRYWNEVEAGSEDPSEHTENEPYTGPVEKWDYTNGGGSRRIPIFWRWIQDGETIMQPGEVRKPFFEISGNSRDSIRRMAWRERLEPDKYEIQVRFYSDPPGGTMKHVNDTYFEFIQEIVYDDFTYPGAALLGVRALATDQLSGGMPRLTCLARRNAVPVSVNGVYEMRSANNPAWAAYDALHDDNYGGGVGANRIVLADFQSWADYCVSKGYEVNIYLDSITDLQRTLNAVTVLGRGAVVQMGSKFTALVDRPSMPVQRFLFTMANIVRDSFATEIMDVDERADCVEVSYFDKEMDYTRQTVFIPGASYGNTAMPVNKTQITLPGETSRKRAADYGKFLLNQNRYLTETASWDADIDALACLPGDVVDVQHDVPRWGQGGMIESAGPDWVGLSRPVIMQPGERYFLSIKFNDDTRAEYEINPVAQETETQTLYVGAFGSKAPQSGDMFSFGTITRAAKQFRVLSITRAAEGRRKIRAIEYIPEVYADDFTPPPIDVTPAPKVESLAVNEVWIAGPDGSGRPALDVSWRGYAVLWSVYIRLSGGSWRLVGETSDGRYLIEGALIIGRTYDVAVTPTKTPSEGRQDAVTIRGKLAPPSDVKNFQAYQSGDVVYFRWDHIPDIDLWGYEIRQGVSWNTAKIVVDGVQENKAAWMPPLSGSYNFLIKALDESGIYSTHATEASLNANIKTPVNVVKDIEETVQANADAGTFENMVYLSNTQEIAWIPGCTDTDFPATANDLLISNYTGNRAPGAYTSQVYDIGVVADFTLRLSDVSRAIIADATDIDLSGLTDQDLRISTDVNIYIAPENILEYRVSDDNVVWSGWKSFSRQTALHSRYFQHKATLALPFGMGALSLQSFRAVADLPDKEVRLTNVAVGVSGVTFDVVPLGLSALLDYYVGVTILGAAALKTAVSKSGTSFTVRLFDQTGNAILGSVDLLIRGC